jgi:hypothetical protein
MLAAVVVFALERRVHAPQQAARSLHRPHRDELDAVAVLHHLHGHAGLELHGFADVLGDDDLELGRQRERGHGVERPSV